MKSFTTNIDPLITENKSQIYVTIKPSTLIYDLLQHRDLVH